MTTRHHWVVTACIELIALAAMLPVNLISLMCGVIVQVQEIVNVQGDGRCQLTCPSHLARRFRPKQRYRPAQSQYVRGAGH